MTNEEEEIRKRSYRSSEDSIAVQLLSEIRMFCLGEDE